MNRQVHKAYPITFDTASVTKDISLEPGLVIGGYIQIDNEANLPPGFSNLGIKSEGNSDLVDPVDIRAWKQRTGGSYLDSVKAFYFDEKRVRINLDASAAPEDDVNLQLVLIYDQSNCN